MHTNFNEIWAVFSTGRGRICGLDAISLSVVFRIAEMQLLGDVSNAQLMRQNFLKHEPRVLGCPIIPEQLDELVEEIKKNTKFNYDVVLNTDGSRRYENLADVGFRITDKGFETVVMTPCGIERA